jgi:hypothetical protein
MKYYLLPLLLFMLAAIHSDAQNREITGLEPFTAIEIRSKAKVHLTTGPHKVEVSSSTDSSDTKTTSADGVLKILGVGDYYISLPELNKIDISGIGTVTADTVIRTSTLRIDISGAGKVVMPVEVDKLRIGIPGLGRVQLAGSANDVQLNISGNGKIDALNLRAGKVEANVSGMTKTYMDVTSALELNISGTGTFYYRTTPAQLTTSISGIGKHNAYTNEDGKDSSVIRIGSYDIFVAGGQKDLDQSVWETVADTILKRPEYSKSHWMGIDLGFNYLASGSGLSSDLPNGYEYLELNSGKSVNVNVNIFAHDFKLYRRYVMFTTGIGLTLNNYRFDSDMTLRRSRPLNAGYDLNSKGDTITYEKNKLAVNYVTVPLLLQFNTHEYNKKSIHFAVGALASYKYNSHLKLVYKEDGDKEKSKRQGEFNIQPFRADLTARVGYRNWTLYASYAMTELFRNGRGPEVHPVQFGVSFLGW